MIDRAVRSPQSVLWGADGIPFLDEARDHLKERQGLERGIIETASERMDDTNGTGLEELRSLVNTLDEIQSRHSGLFSQVCKASKEFQSAQLAAFHARSTAHIADLERDVSLPLAPLPVQALRCARFDQRDGARSDPPCFTIRCC